MAATLTRERFQNSDWVFERKLDGIRMLAFKRGKAVELRSRNRLSQNAAYPALVEAVAALPVEDLILDGELVTWSPSEGRLDFPGLQARMTAGKRIRTVASQRPAQYVAFDVLAAGEEDLRHRPLRERRVVL